jgi:type I restriction enzyme S subunit
MSSQESYTSQRSTDAAWLPSIPSHWSTARGRHIFRIQKRIAGKLGFQVLSVTQTGIKPKDTTSGEGQLSQDYSKYQFVYAGDFVMNHMDLLTGWVDRSQLDGVTSPDYRVFELIDEESDPDFYRLACQVGYIQKLFYAYGQGVSHLGRWRFPADNFKNFVFPKPPLSEQRAAAKAADRETARIDALIEKKTRFIELLKEKRLALITQAVTKGLDPTVPMKDSGVEWIGEVPAHWEVLPVKRLVSIPITDGPHETPMKQDAGIPFVSAEAVRTGHIDFDKIWGYISEADHARYSKKYKPRVGDIYMVKSGATTGVTAMVEDHREFNIWSPLAAMRPNSLVEPNFLLAALRSTSFLDGVAINWSYGTQQNIGMKTLSDLPVAVPSREEQNNILSGIAREGMRVAKLMYATERSIDLLKERRSALITAAVTGQIDLREDAA